MSARDPGAAGNIRVIAEEALARPEFEPVLCASSPALEILGDGPPRPISFDVEPVESPTTERAALLLDEASRILDTVRPDAICAGVSHSLEAGVDEALISSRGDIGGYVMQDFWGDVNSSLGGAADRYFVIDEAAARATADRHAVTVEVVGSPKHASYGSLDPLELRSSTREEAGLSTEHPIVGFFGQNLHSLDGYGSTVRTLARALKGAGLGGAVVFRPHPREDDASSERTCRDLEAEGLDVVVADRGPVERWLASVDVVLSAFSSCCYDALFLTRHSPAPVNAALYLLFEEDVQKYSRAVNGFDVLPPVAEGLAAQVTEAQDLERALAEAATSEARGRTWERARSLLPDPSMSATKILDRILADVPSRT